MKQWIKQLLIVGVATLGAQGSVDATDRVLNWKSYQEIRDYADRGKDDMHYLNIPWKETVFDGLVAGQKADKPVLLWLYFGDGRGHC